MTIKSDVEYNLVLIDATETPIERPKKRQREFYSGKKKRHTLKSQVLVDKRSSRIVCTAFCKGKCHDFKLLKDSKVYASNSTKVMVDSGYQGLQKIHTNTELAKKATKLRPLTRQDKRSNRELARQRVLCENVIGMLKRFKIVADRYRNRRKRFSLRFNLISAIYNLEIPL